MLQYYAMVQFSMKFNKLLFFFPLIFQAFLVVLAAVAIVSAVPVDETLPEAVYGNPDTYSPQEDSEFFKLKKLKKIFFG